MKITMIQAHVLYSGMVQGVGFRYTVQRLASGEGLNGWVRNLSDGRVEMLVEGEKPAVDDLLSEIAEQFKGYITGKDISYDPPQGRYKGFIIIS